MTGSPDDLRATADLFDFVSLYLADRQDGVVRPLAEYQARFPGHGEPIAAEFQRLEQERDPTAPPREFGRYRIVRRLGGGGQGTVLLAEDTRLHRRVALKILAPHLDFQSRERLERFRREAEILSHLDHPGICVVFEADTVDDVPYLAMRYVEGRTMAALLAEQRQGAGPPRTRAALHRVMRWVEAAALAAHEAHEAQVVHRDIKPGNLMITPQDRPVLLDFGLARHQSATCRDVTSPGALFGTLPYMAPELLGERVAEADRRVDVYALGVTLYECITLSLPFEAETPTGLWRAIASGEPIDPRLGNPAIPRELAMVVATALARTPTQRYATARELADDLARVRHREPIHARPLPFALRAVRFAQRHPRLAAVVATLTVLLAGLTMALREVSANSREVSALNRALLATASDESAAAALAELVTVAESGPDPSMRSAVLRVLPACNLAFSIARTPAPPSDTDPPPVLDPAGRWIALGDSRGRLALYDVKSGQLTTERVLGAGPVRAVLFAGESLIASVGDDSPVVLRASDLREQGRLDVAGPSDGLARSPDGHTVAVAARGSLVLWNLSSSRPVAQVPLDPAVAYRRLQWSPTGDAIVLLGRHASVDPDAYDRLAVVDAHAATLLQETATDDQGILAVDWHPHEALLALAYNGGRVRIVAAEGGTPRFEVAVGQEVNWCGFDATGELLLVPSDTGTALWRWRSTPPRVERMLANPNVRTVGAAAFSTGHDLLATAHRDGTVVLRSTRDWRPIRTFKQRMVDVRWLCWLPGDGMLLTADLHKLSAWCAGVRPHLPECWATDEAITDVTFDPAGEVVASASHDGTARLWSPHAAAPRVQIPHDAPLRKVRFSPDGRLLVTVADDPVLRVFATADGAPRAVLRGHDGNVADAFFADRQRLISVGDDGRCVVWNVEAARAERTMQASDAPIRSAALHPSRPWLATGGADRRVTVWNWQTGEQVQRFFVSDSEGDWHINPIHQVRGVCFQPRSDRLLASLVNNYLLTWDIGAGWRRTSEENDCFGGAMAFDPATGEVLCADYSFGLLSAIGDGRAVPLRIDGQGPHQNRIAALAVAPGGGIALSAGQDAQLWLWNLAARTPTLGIRCDSAILAADFSPDGRWIVTGCADGKVTLWPVDPIAVAREYLARRRTP